MAFLNLLSSKPFGADPGFHLCAGEPQFGLLLPELSPCQLRCVSKLSQLKGLHSGSGEAPAQPKNSLHGGFVFSNPSGVMGVHPDNLLPWFWTD